MKNNIYKAVLSADSGDFVLWVNASNKKAAIQRVLNNESCPESAIKTLIRVPKFIYGWKLFVNYGQGWEYETFEDTWTGYKENRKAYQENHAYPQRWSKGREPNSAVPSQYT